ncbi:unknown [Azospirillum sp. CAG:260]|nr:unknown [Azospirillum sp. CAG:260]
MGDNMKSNSQEVSTGEKILNFLIKLPQYVGAIIKFIFFLAVFAGAVFLLKQCS